MAGAWSGFGFDGCEEACACGCGCIVTDDFTTDTLSVYDVTDEAGFAVAGGQLTSTASGEASRQIELPSGSLPIGVEAELTDNSHTLFGLIIGSNDNRIEWLWDTAGTQCRLLVVAGGTSIVATNYAGAPATSLKLMISGSDGEWNITAYRDGTLVASHPAVAVTFGTGWVPAGVTSTGGGTWDNLCLISCDPLCTTGADCNTHHWPKSWTLSVGTVESAAGCDPCCPSCCAMLGGDWILAGPEVIYDLANASCELSQTDLSNGSCGAWGAVLASDTLFAGSCADNDETFFPKNPLLKVSVVGQTLFGGGWDGQLYAYNDACSSEVGAPDYGACGDVTAWHLAVDTTTSPGNVIIRAHVAMQYGAGWGQVDSVWSGVYESAPIPWSSPFDFTALGPTTLSLVPGDGFESDITLECDFPATITLTPNTGEDAEVIAGCRPLPCQPSWETDILNLVITYEGGILPVCIAKLTATSWSGSAVFDCSPDVTLTVTIERRGLHYWLIISDAEGTNVDEFVVECSGGIASFAEASGELTNTCGGTAMAASINECHEEDYAFPCCPEKACCPPSCISADGQLSGGEGICATTSVSSMSLANTAPPGSPTGLTAGDYYYYGDFPFDDGMGTYTDWQLLIYCNGGMAFAVIDSTGTVRKQGAIANWDCVGWTGDPIDVTDLIVISSCFSSWPDATATIALSGC